MALESKFIASLRGIAGNASRGRLSAVAKAVRRQILPGTGRGAVEGPWRGRHRIGDENKRHGIVKARSG